MSTVSPGTRRLGMTVLVASVLAIVGMPVVTDAQVRQPPPQRIDFELGYQHGDPSFDGFSWPWQSPDLFDVLRQSNIDVDRLLQTAGRDIDWLLAQIGKDTAWLLERSQLTSGALLEATGRSADWLIGRLGKDADWILQASGHSIGWLVDRTGATADELLGYAGKDADWLLDQLGKDVGWILQRSGHDKEDIIAWAGKSNDWVVGVVKRDLCGNLGIGKGACERGVDLVKGSLSKLMGKISRSADWWLDEVGEDADWLLEKAGKTNDWMLAEAGKSRAWLFSKLNRDADWLLAKTGHTKAWLLQQSGRSVDWLVEQAGYNNAWVFKQLGGTNQWLLATANRDADWVLAQVGWRMQDAELVLTALLELRVVNSEGVQLTYPGAAQLQYLPGTPQTPRYDRRILVGAGDLMAVEGLGSSNASITATYTDPTGITVSAGGDAGMFNQDVAIIIETNRRVGQTSRHADGWLITMCIPLKEILAAVLAEVPPAAAAVLVLLPDIMMQVNGDVGYRLSNEQVLPPAGQIVQFNLPQPQRYYDFNMQWGGQVSADARLKGGSWGFAWGLMCGPGFGISLGYKIPGGETLVRAGPNPVRDTVLVRFPLAAPSDWGRPPPAPGTVAPGTGISPRPPRDTSPVDELPELQTPDAVEPVVAPTPDEERVAPTPDPNRE